VSPSVSIAAQTDRQALPAMSMSWDCLGLLIRPSELPALKNSSEGRCSKQCANK